MNMISHCIEESIKSKQQILEDENLLNSVQQAADVIVASLNKGGRIYFCGNGGSAADAQHLAAEFSGRFYKNRKALPAEALHTNSSYITAVANDYSYDIIYSRLVEGIMNEGDVLIGLSTSGNSANIVKAFEAARANKITTIAFTGMSGGILKSGSDILLNMPSANTPRIQECHMLLGHIICLLVENACFPSTT